MPTVLGGEKNQKSRIKRQKAKVKNAESEVIRRENVFIFAFCLLPFDF